MEIEYRDKSGVFYPAIITQIGVDKIALKSKDDAFPEGWYSFSDCRYVRSMDKPKRNITAGDSVDALIKQASDKKVYQRVKVREIKVRFNT